MNRRHQALALLAVTMSLCVSASSATADTGLRAPTDDLRTLVAGQFMPKGILLTGADPTNQMFSCDLPFATVANLPGGYAIGNCPQGSYFGRTQLSQYVSTPPAGYFNGGYVSKPFDGCGWIFDTYIGAPIQPGVDVTSCKPPGNSRASTTFIKAGAGNLNCLSPCIDGTSIDNPLACPKYSNFRPWSDKPKPIGLIATLPAHARGVDANSGATGWRLKWRYVGRMPSTDGSGEWVMVRDITLQAGQGNWSFVPRSCLGI